MRTAIASAALVSAIAAASLPAQKPATFRSSVDTVEVHVTVRGADGQIVTGLTKDDFELYDNGKRQDITVFSSDLQPVTIALVLDRSGSIAGQARKVAAAAEEFVGELLPADRASVGSLSFECQPLTSDFPALVAMLRSAMPSDLGSPIWASVDSALSSLSGEAGRRALLLLSDGDDMPILTFGSARPNLIAGPCHMWPHPSEATLTDDSKRAQRDGVTVYTVSVENSGTKDDDLRSIARDSGGDRYRLKQDSELSAAFKRIADELHHQYLLGFVPVVFDGKVHELDVRVKRPGTNVHSRKSYVAERDTSMASGSTSAGASISPLSTTELEQAIRNGSAGQKLQASCMASTVFPKSPKETDAFVDVVLEGPVGRIMRQARDARGVHSPFSAADVTDEMRAATVTLSAELKPTLRPAEPQSSEPPAFGQPAAPPVAPPPPLRGLMSLRLRSKELSEIILAPLSEKAPGRTPGSPPGLQRVAEFSLAAFKALPGHDVEVVATSGQGVRHCTISAKDKAAIR